MTQANTFKELAALETEDHVLWPHGLDPHGYGRVWRDGRMHQVHRLALQGREAGPAGALACHRPAIGCPRRCMNYRHLYWGTHVDNAADMIADGTLPVGGRNGKVKLTEADVHNIRQFSEVIGCRETARRLGVSPATVSLIRRRLRWQHLE